MTTTDITRTRKLWAYYWAVGALLAGLVACLLTAWLSSAAAMLIGGLFAPYATGIGAALHLFIRGNVQVHQANADGTAAPGGGA